MIKEFSADSTLGDDSHDKVPTQRAVKWYVDANDADWSPLTNPAAYLQAMAGGLATNGSVLYGTAANTHINLGFSSALGLGSATVSQTGDPSGLNNLEYCTLVGGADNSVEGSFSTIIGGLSNRVTGAGSVAIGVFSFVSGGTSGVLSGSSNTVYQDYSVIAGGDGNEIRGSGGESAILGGRLCIIEDGSEKATIGGGGSNQIASNADYTTIVGGYSSIIQSGAHYSFIGGGIDQFVGTNADDGVICGGHSNYIQQNADQCFVGGGYANEIESGSVQCVIAGGLANGINGYHSAIGGGRWNQVSGTISCIPGGDALEIGSGCFGFRGGVGGLSKSLLDLSGVAYENSFLIENAHFRFNNANENADFQINGDTYDDVFYMDASEHSIGIGTNSPTAKIDVNLSSNDGDSKVGIDIANANSSSTVNLLKMSSSGSAATMLINNTYSSGVTNALEVEDGGGRVKLSYAEGGAANIPGDVSIYKFTSTPGSASIDDAEAGQFIIIINDSGGMVTVEGTAMLNGLTYIFVSDGTGWFAMGN